MRKTILAGIAAAALAAAPTDAEASVAGTSGASNTVIGDVEGRYGTAWTLFSFPPVDVEIWFIGRNTERTPVTGFTFGYFEDDGVTFPAKEITFEFDEAGIVGGQDLPGQTGLSSLFVEDGFEPILLATAESAVAFGFLNFTFTALFDDGFGSELLTVTNTDGTAPPTLPHLFTYSVVCDHDVPIAACPFAAGNPEPKGGRTLLMALSASAFEVTGGLEFPNDALVMALRFKGTESELTGTPVPEPASLALLGMGLLGLGFAARRRR